MFSVIVIWSVDEDVDGRDKVACSKGCCVDGSV